MPKKPATTHTLYIRQFPRDITRIIKSRAALGGMSMSRYLASVLRDYLDLKKSA